MFERFMSEADTDRASRALQKLLQHDTSRWALTGGIAVEVYALLSGRRPSPRSLNDIDFVTDSFDCVPESLADDFLFRHIHPFDPPGKTMLQLIEADSRLRIDVFRAYGATMDRTTRLHLPFGTVRLISLVDLTARTARLALDLADDKPTPSKHAKDFLRLIRMTDDVEVEAVWPEHRKPAHPATFQEAKRLLRRLIPTSRHLLITPKYSTDVDASCSRCVPTAALHLAEPKLVLSLLGYC